MAKASPCSQTPALDTGVAAAVLIVNVIASGMGTLIAGIVGTQPRMGRAFAQFLLAIIVVG